MRSRQRVSRRRQPEREAGRLRSARPGRGQRAPRVPISCPCIQQSRNISIYARGSQQFDDNAAIHSLGRSMASAGRARRENPNVLDVGNTRSRKIEASMSPAANTTGSAGVTTRQRFSLGGAYQHARRADRLGRRRIPPPSTHRRVSFRGARSSHRQQGQQPRRGCERTAVQGCRSPARRGGISLADHPQPAGGQPSGCMVRSRLGNNRAEIRHALSRNRRPARGHRRRPAFGHGPVTAQQPLTLGASQIAARHCRGLCHRRGSVASGRGRG